MSDVLSYNLANACLMRFLLITILIGNRSDWLVLEGKESLAFDSRLQKKIFWTLPDSIKGAKILRDFTLMNSRWDPYDARADIHQKFSNAQTWQVFMILFIQWSIIAIQICVLFSL